MNLLGRAWFLACSGIVLASLSHSPVIGADESVRLSMTVSDRAFEAYLRSSSHLFNEYASPVL
jgi:hypothetical protein